LIAKVVKIGFRIVDLGLQILDLRMWKIRKREL
jgi:hypothetical protein